MTIQHLHIDGFGKLTNLDLTFSDGMNLIYGSNEAGKSTLCSFIFHMFYGLERGRGRASRFDAYVRYLPWHSATYGGSITFTADGSSWFLERSFLTDTRFIRLTCLDNGMSVSDPQSILAQLMGKVSESSFRSLFFVESHRICDMNTLSDQFRQYTQNLPGSGSMYISSNDALRLLKRQKKEAMAQLADVTPKDLLLLREELEQLKDQATISEHTYPEQPYATKTRSSFFIGFIRFICVLVILFGGIVLNLPALISGASISSLRLLLGTSTLCAGLLVLLLSSKKKELPPDESICASSPVTGEYIITLSEQLAVMEQQLEHNRTIHTQIAALQLAIDRITDLSTQIHHSNSSDLQRVFLRHANSLTGRPFTQLFIDENFRFSLMEEGHVVPLEAMSRGTVEQLMLACRLASMEYLYPNVSLPILLDDIFTNTDDKRLAHLLTRLYMDYPGQKFVFCCKKREAAILSQLSLTYQLINL